MKTRQPTFPPPDPALLARLGERLRLERKRRGLSESAVAQQAGIARATLQRVELGAGAVAMGTWLRILAVLGHEQDLERLVRLPAHRQGEAAAVRRRPAWVAGPGRRAPWAERIRVRDYPQLGQLARIDVGQ